MSAKADSKGGKKGSTRSFPPKPSTLSDEQWELANTPVKLVELIATPERSSAKGVHAVATKSQVNIPKLLSAFHN
jgi:hypothetical protein